MLDWANTVSLAFFLTLPAMIVGWILWVVIAQFLHPINSWRQSLNRPKAAWLLGFGLWLVAFSVPLVLFQRPYFSAVIVLAGWLTVVLVSNVAWKRAGSHR